MTSLDYKQGTVRLICGETLTIIIQKSHRAEDLQTNLHLWGYHQLHTQVFKNCNSATIIFHRCKRGFVTLQMKNPDIQSEK